MSTTRNISLPATSSAAYPSTGGALNKNRIIIQSNLHNWTNMHFKLTANKKYGLKWYSWKIDENQQLKSVEVRPINMPPKGIKIGLSKYAGNTVFGMKKWKVHSVKNTNKSSFEHLLKKQKQNNILKLNHKR